MISSCPRVPISDPVLVHQVLSIKNVAFKLRSALDEVLDSLPSIDNSEDKEKSEHERDQLQSSAVDIARQVCESMSSLSDNIQLTPLPVLLEGALIYFTRSFDVHHCCIQMRSLP
jgi:hypothetical protein